MLIFWKERLAFLANTRTGSSSIERALEGLAAVSVMRPPALKHLSAGDFHAHLSPLFTTLGGARFTTVALIRDPVDWLGSWYRYRQREDIAHAAGSSEGMRFADFAESYLAGRIPGIAPQTPADGGTEAATSLGTQADFLCDADGACHVDRLFRYDAIARFLHFLDDRLGCDITLPRLNVAPQGDLALPPPLLDALRHHFARDLALYGQAEA